MSTKCLICQQEYEPDDLLAGVCADCHDDADGPDDLLMQVMDKQNDIEDEFQTFGDMKCPGCNALLDDVQLAGYRTYCTTCFEAFPALPECGGHPAGKYPNMFWIPASITNEAQQNGYEDFMLGIKRENNRYPFESDNWEEWLNGYDIAKNISGTAHV